MKFRFMVTVDVAHTGGPQEGREEIAELVRAELEGVAIDDLTGPEGGEYTIEEITVSDEVVQGKRAHAE
jgi:hypothetical protein